MSKLKDLLKDQSSGGEEKPAGLNVSKILKEIGEELKHQGAMGAQELAAGMFHNHDGFVMYPKGMPETDGHGLPETVKEAEKDLGPEL